MAVRLRPQSAAWMAPHALAAQLNAQTGQIAGQGVAGLLGGIAQGVGAYTQKREQRRVEGINEQRYQDSLMRQDRAFNAAQLMNQFDVQKQLFTVANAEYQQAAMVDPESDEAKRLFDEVNKIRGGMLNVANGIRAEVSKKQAEDCGPEG